MGLFDKKYCDICGEKIGMLGNRKLSDGNCCKNCAKKLSPWFSERKQSTVEDIKEQLAYREANMDKVAAFNVTRTLGNGTKVMLDEQAQLFMVTSARNLREANPDVLAFSDVTGVDIDVNEHKWEEKRQDAQGNEVSYNPPRWRSEYDFYVKIYVNNPYFDQMRFKLNGSSIDERDYHGRKTCEDESNEIKSILLNARQNAYEAAAAAAAPKMAVTCPWCGATTMADAAGCCEYCGGALNG